MGSLGARRLNAGSDLDLIVIYDAPGQEASDGRRPLETRTYYARLTQALVTALTAPMAEGRLYEVDMRLRPSGRQGPVATSWAAFQDYQRNDAWTWEHLALTRARAIAGEPMLNEQFEVFRQDLIRATSKGDKICVDVLEMRDRISAAKPSVDRFDPKIGPGRLQDIELFSQSVALRSGSSAGAVATQLASGVADGWLDAADAQALTDTAALFWQLQASLKLLADGTLEIEQLGEGATRLILRETDCADMRALEARLAAAHIQSDKIVRKYLEPS
jgi:glutamate-ammonia-ligase adenylyltransferase